MDEKEKYVHSVFQSVAGGYDAANDRISMGRHLKWKRRAARLCCAGLGAGAEVLDVGCGTGDMLRIIGEDYPGIRLTGIDFSANMLAGAEKNCAGLTCLRLVEGNAARLPFQDGTFDGAVISFALRNTSDHARVIGEMTRTVRAGGRICCIDSFIPACRLVRPAYGIYFRFLMPLLGGGIKNSGQYRWLARSTRQFVSAKELAEMMRSCGLNDIETVSFMCGACVCVSGRK